MRQVPQTYNVSSVTDIPDYRNLVGVDIIGGVLHYTDIKENHGSAQSSDKLDDLRGYFSFRIHRRMDGECGFHVLPRHCFTVIPSLFQDEVSYNHSRVSRRRHAMTYKIFIF